MSRDVITVGSTMRILLLYQGEYSQWRERFMNYLEEQTDGEAMINSIHNDLKFWTAEEKKTRKIDCLARSLVIQGLPNDIYSLIDSKETAKDLWDALERQMRGSEYAEQDRKATILYEYETFKATEGEQLLDTYLRDVNDALGYKKKAVVVTSNPLALLAEKIKKEDKKADEKKRDMSKVKCYNCKNEGHFAKDCKKAKKVEKKPNEKKIDMSKVKCYNCKNEGHFSKDCKKAKVKDYNYYKTKMLLAKKDSEDQAWIEFSSDSDQEINANMIFMD
nr:hypothetical protein [Tanacetum cinerariifolium]